MSRSQSSDLLRFIQYLNIDSYGNVITNVIDDEEPNFISRFYTPHFRVNKVSEKVLERIQDKDIVANNTTLDKDSLTYKLTQTGLKLSAPKIYQLAQATVLDAFSLIYTIEEERELIKYFEQEDIQQTRESVQYLIDYLGNDQKYSSIAMDFMGMDTALGYIQGQVPLLKKEQREEGSIY